MAHTMDLGVPEAYRHEAVTEYEVRQSRVAGGYCEWITVRCGCGKFIEGEFPHGTYEAFEDEDEFVEELVLGQWKAHVWDEIKQAGQVKEARANSAASSDDDGHNPPPYSDEPSSVSLTIRPAVATGLSFEEERAKVAEHYADVVERSLATLRQSLESKLAPGESRSAMLRWFAQNIQDQGDMMARRLDELGGREL